MGLFPSIIIYVDVSSSCIKDFTFDVCQSSWIAKSMANSLVIVFGASEIDKIGDVCSIWTNFDPVSYQKFVIKWPTWQLSGSLLQKSLANQMSGFTFKSNFHEFWTTETKKILEGFLFCCYFEWIYQDRNKLINFWNQS